VRAMTSPDDLNALASLFHLAGQLKNLKRQGWIDRGVDQPESVADHSWRLALMTLLIASRDPGIDAGRAVRLALVHDLPEAITGDITPFDDQLQDSETDRASLFHDLPEYSEAADQTKTSAERQAIYQLTADLPTDLSTMLIESWEEYEAGETAEARLVRQLDKLETWLQALEYQQMQPDLIIESFRKGTERDVNDPELVALRAEIDRLFSEAR
jgi:putative hydrolases of HD superfamily